MEQLTVESMRDKMALVTGGGAGIGRAIALAFARAGAGVMIGDIDLATAEEVAGLIRAEGGTALAIRCDVAQPGDAEAMVRATVESLGRLDYAINNAGVAIASSPVAEQPIESWDRTVAINLSGVFYCMKYEIAAMLPAGGAIVNIASALGTVGFAGSSAYVAAKHGVLGLTKTAALEYATRRIRVNAICPGFIETPMLEQVGILGDPDTRATVERLHAMRRLGNPDEVAGAALYLCSDAASFVTGHALAVDGGYVAR